MWIRRALGLSLIVATVSISLPVILSAQNNGQDDRPLARIKVLDSGDIQVIGEFVFENDSGSWDKEIRVNGSSLISIAKSNADASEPVLSQPPVPGPKKILFPNGQAIESSSLEASDTIWHLQDARIFVMQ